MNGYLRAFLATVLFIVILLITHYIHMRFLSVDVVLYAAIIDAGVAIIACAVILWISGQARKFSGLERTLLVLVWVLGGYSFAISIPTVVDRSLSFYILEKLQQRGGGIEQARMKDVFINEYMLEHRLVDIRLTEQLESGTIVIRNGCVLLTEKGQRVAAAGRFYRTHLLPRHRLIMGGYSDDLTDPFRHSSAEVSYQCH